MTTNTPKRVRRASMADVAKLAGVSAQTVSRVSNGHAGVVEETRQQVLDAMKQLGYRPNGAARALKWGEFRTIGVIMFTLSTTGNLLGRSHIALPPGIPVVVVDSDAGSEYVVVDTDQAAGARSAVDHLLGLGHRTVWHVAGPEDSFASQRRVDAWQGALADAGRDAPPLIRGDWSAESGYRAGLLLADEPGCTAVFAANDQMALGILRALRERGRDVPADVSVVGFDDVPDAGSYSPPLTTVHQDFTQVGRRCVDGVLRQVRSDDGVPEPGTTLVPTTLTVRSSTAPPRV
ncbi:MAG: LacI family transcriptional regulator [Oerskovia sp.]|nr:LacI family transcriptional regulator [Oerskovia sp.]